MKEAGRLLPARGTDVTDPGLALLVFGLIVASAGALFWPRYGVVPRLLRLSRLDSRVRLEDALKHIYMCDRNDQTCSLESLAGRLEVSTAHAADLLSRLGDMGLVRSGGAGPTLTDEGKRSAVQVVRNHRLWERYLAERTGVPPGEWHDRAERMEHALSAEQADVLESHLGHPQWDPHGDPIPTSAGELTPVQGVALAAVEPGRTVEIVHLEDEPRQIYDALVAGGLALGGRLDVVERTDRAVRVRARGREWTIDPVAARNVTVLPRPEGAAEEPELATLLDARPGETVRVAGISRACRGAQRRRLLDLGVVRDTEITPELVSATGDPIAYRIRGALIALRRAQAVQVLVQPAGGPPAAEAR
jgi:DtxR family Mn-dependent transcriptional regulator